MSAALNEATQRQRQAADPAYSVYVSANAGSGKTRVLVSRVSRLLLRGTPPAKIMCLTYTKAAASEMQTRLYETLGKWSVMGDADLQKALVDLDGQTFARRADDLRAARELFAKALETPEGLKVHTIHAFCERLLRRFPVESGIAPGFDSMDDRDKKTILNSVKSQIFSKAMTQPDSELAGAISLLAADYPDSTIDAMLGWAAQSNYDVSAWERAGLGPLADKLGVPENMTQASAARRAWDEAPHGALKRAADELESSGKSNQKIAQIIYDALEASSPEDSFEIYSAVFLTGAGALRKSVSYSGVADHLFGSEKKGYGSEVTRVIAAIEQIKAVKTLALTRAVHTLARPAASLYTAGKRARRLMDFTDQIMLAKNLLTNSAAREWVLCKLDGGVDHILLDEAQDTSPQQWDIIEAIADEFDAVENSGRTKFAVGDEKQSIYSFQGAKPELFLSRTQAAISADTQTRAVPMSMSFRSAPQILSMVDAVFADCGALNQIFDSPPAGDLPRHSANRIDDGCVELWPLAPAPEKGEPESAWEFPVDQLSAQSSREQLAHEISVRIDSWLKKGEAIYDRELKRVRPMRAGDIMILVRSRSPFFNAVIRHLKLAGVPVAGADKLKLTDNIGVQDLISLGRFICLPSDDLSLAEVLKSPIFNLSDEALLSLAYKRAGSLWDALNTSDDQAMFEARSVLRKIVKIAPDHAPYELYARVLSMMMPAQSAAPAQSTLKRLYARLGIEAADPIEAFLSRALAHQRSGPPSLERFLHELDGDGAELKREMEAAQNEVRVMTVHGSKGLETPVVILPDTTQAEKTSIRSFEMEKLTGDQDQSQFDGFVVRQAKGEVPQVLEPMAASRERAASQEGLRLLYVAMTRAESRLVICGFESGAKKLDEGSWYDWAQRGFTHLAGAQPEQMRESEHVFGTLKTYGRAALAPAGLSSAPDAPTILPDWCAALAPLEGRSAGRVTPSHLLAGLDQSSENLPAARSPLDILNAAGADGSRKSGYFKRGNIIHKLLEILPDIAPDKRAGAAQNFLSAQADLPQTMQEQITREVFGVIDNPEFASLFAPGSRAEIALAGSASGLPEGVFINAQIDRLAVSDHEVWIVDYKSNRPPPAREDDVPNIYIAQMAAYRILAQDIYPKKTIRCALLWTDVPHLMELSSQRLDKFDLRAVLTR